MCPEGVGVCKCWIKCSLLSCVRFFVTCGLQPTRLLCPWSSPDKNSRVGSHSFLQRISLPDPEIEPESSTLQADSLLPETPGMFHILDKTYAYPSWLREPGFLPHWMSVLFHPAYWPGIWLPEKMLGRNNKDVISSCSAWGWRGCRVSSLYLV